MLRYSPSTPLFDESFVNYGYNKVQLIEHLRQSGYTFYILNHAFAMDFPHPEYVILILLFSFLSLFILFTYSSPFRQYYNPKYDLCDNSGVNTTHRSQMKNAFNAFQQSLLNQYANITNTHICYGLQPSYYEEIYVKAEK